jgi:hypothetical protein
MLQRLALELRLGNGLMISVTLLGAPIEGWTYQLLTFVEAELVRAIVPPAECIRFTQSLWMNV